MLNGKANALDLLAMLPVHIYSAFPGTARAQGARARAATALPEACCLQTSCTCRRASPPPHLPMPLRFFKGLLGLGPRLSMISVHPNGSHLASIAHLLSAGTLRSPRISATFPLERAGEAHAFLEGVRGPRPPGKVVLQVARPVLAEKSG